ncbi:MAG: hypothetical protein ACFFEF_10740 [Candidatus Thorarchaeota archaeon]
MIKARLQQQKSLSEYKDVLIRHAYQELQQKRVSVVWAKMKSFAMVAISDSEPILIKCSNSVRGWPEPALIGLLSHELSHVVMGTKRHGEEDTDMDVIARGLGTYLALERALCGKYTDHFLKKGTDRYLGYDSIRNRLSFHEKHNLDKLMGELELIPEEAVRVGDVHDFSIMKTDDSILVIINGEILEIDRHEDVDDIKFVIRGNVMQILVNESIVGSIEMA